ncbi:hypothetical protein BOTBODRAFT_440312 [Botryobasidium botryosum FD-172 SS1]|uniref:Uncharacterized protein n=1 Tax=Botryobasidium botryosum (strain FD-172 SS1) TaxID=930990 RepID=A0A067MV61_BOTB1|nr:hypothetical protein BOTBODRAFT_440312 [Botryobasidium botryosum FD-172 SS1]
MERTVVSANVEESWFVITPGAVITVRLPQGLRGPGSRLTSAQSLPSGATRANYHHAVVLRLIGMPRDVIDLLVLPIPAYSAEDPDTGLSSTRWLLEQPQDFQDEHIPIPYHSNAQHPPFPTPPSFGAPLNIGGWRHTSPSWVLTVPQSMTLKYTASFKHYDRPLVLDRDELIRLRKYATRHTQPTPPEGGGTFPPPTGDGNASFGGSGPSSGNHILLSHPTHTQTSGEDASGSDGGANLGGSAELQALYASDSVKLAYETLARRPEEGVIYIDGDDDDEDDDEEWEDTMDPVTFARYYAPQNPYMAMIVERHEKKVQQDLERDTKRWLDGLAAAGAPGVSGGV